MKFSLWGRLQDPRFQGSGLQGRSKKPPELEEAQATGAPTSAHLPPKDGHELEEGASSRGSTVFQDWVLFAA